MNDTELLRFILGHMFVAGDDIDWPYSDNVRGLKDVGADHVVVEELIKRREELLKEEN